MSFKRAHQSIQKSLWMYSKSGYVGGTLQAILGAARLNNTITAQDIGKEPGKKRTLKVNYLPPVCEDDGTCSDNPCDSGEKSEPLQTYFTLKQCTSSKVLQIDIDDMRDLDNIGANEWVMGMLNQRWDTVRRKLEVQLTAILLANRGVLPDGNASKLINLLDISSNRVRPDGIFDLERAYIDAQLSTPYVIGSAPVYNIKRLLAIGAPNDDGQDISKVAVNNWFYDKNLNGAIGNSAENLVAFDPQLIKFLGWNWNLGRFATDNKDLKPETMFQEGPNWMFSTILDPATGILWDLDMHFLPCGKKITFQFKLNWDLFTLPMDVCAIQGLNGIMHFTTCAPKPVDCTGQGAPSGGTIAAKDYEYDPGFVYPLIVNDFTINGNTFRPLTTLASDADMVAMFNQFGGGGFTLTAGKITYSGYSAIAGKINVTAYTFTEVV
ncbi:hypothetical protein [Chitinophaga sp. YIM B06452]|uniref:hypothetical protein n=1 Tax=Chitinophaga sp. YIM B06452 TaxID=3082158 RepID=UPI0031FE957A